MTSAPTTVVYSTSSAEWKGIACSSTKLSHTNYMQGGAAQRSGKILQGDKLIDVDGRPVSKQVMKHVVSHTFDLL